MISEDFYFIKMGKEPEHLAQSPATIPRRGEARVPEGRQEL